MNKDEKENNNKIEMIFKHQLNLIYTQLTLQPVKRKSSVLTLQLRTKLFLVLFFFYKTIENCPSQEYNETHEEIDSLCRCTDARISNINKYFRLLCKNKKNTLWPTKSLTWKINPIMKIIHTKNE